MRQFIFEHSPDQSPSTKRNAPSNNVDTVKCIRADEAEDIVTISLHKSNLKRDEGVDVFIRENPTQAIDLIKGTEPGTLIDRGEKQFNVHSHIAAIALEWYEFDENCIFSRRVGEALYEEKRDDKL